MNYETSNEKYRVKLSEFIMNLLRFSVMSYKIKPIWNACIILN
jgi:hypothetical protein